MKIYYRFQYNTGELSGLIQDDRSLFDEFISYLNNAKVKYPVAVFVIKLKEAL